MRILMVTEDIPARQVGGLGKHVVTLSNALLEQGHEVAILGRSDVGYDEHRQEIGFRGRFLPGFHLQHAGWKEGRLGVWMPFKRASLARRIEAAIARHAADFDVVHYHGHLPMVGQHLPLDLPLLQTRHDQGSDCLTHLRFVAGEVCSATAPEACARCAAPAPSILQRTVSTAAVRQFRRQVADNFAQRRTVFVSDFLRQQFSRTSPAARLDRTEVIHNFIDLTRLNSLAAGQAPLAGSLILVGRVDQSKGFAAFLSAWRDAGRPGLPRLVGDGPDRPMLEKTYGDEAEFLGWQPYDEAVRQTARSHVCIVPSILQESCGTTILEALALGRPCLALARGGTPELARYQRYPGQLQLAPDMPSLVALLPALLAVPPQGLPPATAFEADVRQVLPRLLEAYGRTRAEALHPATSEV